MSWNIYSVSVTGGGTVSASISEHVRQAEEKTPGYSTQFEREGSRDQVHAAVAAVEGLIESGAVGSGPWTLNLAGHSNPGHVAEDGWAPEMVSIALHEVPAQRAPQEGQDG